MNLVFLTTNHFNGNRYVKAVSILLFLLSLSLFSQSPEAPFEFPFKPGILEGPKFQSHTDMIKACQIPENILKSMSTKALVRTCLQYPLFGDVFAYDNFQFGFERMSSNFNGFKELFQRSDIAESVLQEYIDLNDLVSLEAKNITEKWRFMFLEILLSQPSIIKNLSLQKKKTLFYEAIKKFSAKMKQPEKYGCFSLTPSCLVMARLLNGQVKSGKGELDFKISKFTEKAFIADSETRNAIIIAAEKYLQN